MIVVDRVVPRDEFAVAGTQLLERAARVEEELKATRGLMDERFDDSIAQSNKQLVKVPIDLFSTGGNPISRSADQPISRSRQRGGFLTARLRSSTIC